MQTASIQAVKPNPTILDYACTKVSSAYSCLEMMGITIAMVCDPMPP